MYRYISDLISDKNIKINEWMKCNVSEFKSDIERINNNK